MSRKNNEMMTALLNSRLLFLPLTTPLLPWSIPDRSSPAWVICLLNRLSVFSSIILVRVTS